MRPTAGARVKQRAQVIPLLIGVVSLLLMPVDYRAGAAVAHPHSIVELISDLAHGSLNHHDRHAAGAVHDHADQLHRLQAERVIALPVGVGTTGSVLAASAASIRATMTMLSRDASRADHSDDAPTLSPRTAAGKFVAFPLSLPLAAILLSCDIETTRPWFQKVAWEGRTPAPELPPPRDSAPCFTPSVP